MNILIIGGTRNIGFSLAKRFLEDGHRLTILNRGISQDDLPDDIARLRCDRTDLQQMRRALSGRQFDIVVDTVIYRGPEAEDLIDILDGQIGHYIFLSTGQVYLVREGLPPGKTLTENDYAGVVRPAPELNTYDYEEWLYGKEKRDVEDLMQQAFQQSGFPYTALRLPMVNSERDKFKRVISYILRIADGGPILVPDGPQYPLRHVYARDVVEAIIKAAATDQSIGRAYNISQDETLSLHEFLDILGDVMGKAPHLVEVEREHLKVNGFLPDCSPYSDHWMSIMDNTRSKQELGISYTPVRDYLAQIVADYHRRNPEPPISYRRRHAEKQFVMSH